VLTVTEYEDSFYLLIYVITRTNLPNHSKPSIHECYMNLASVLHTTYTAALSMSYSLGIAIGQHLIQGIHRSLIKLYANLLHCSYNY
jgi:hypothetical protein